MDRLKLGLTTFGMNVSVWVALRRNLPIDVSVMVGMESANVLTLIFNCGPDVSVLPLDVAAYLEGDLWVEEIIDDLIEDIPHIKELLAA